MDIPTSSSPAGKFTQQNTGHRIGWLHFLDLAIIDDHWAKFRKFRKIED